MIRPLFIKDRDIFDGDERRVATIIGISTPEELERLYPEDGQPQNIVLDLLDWQVQILSFIFFQELVLECFLISYVAVKLAS